MSSNRIKFLDGLRGVAILLVIGFHAYVRWPNAIPYGNTFADFPLFMFGWLGVNLFFIISGFVILMTLDRCTRFWEFGVRRFLRLFPAMLICSIIVVITSPLFPERPAGAVVLRDFLPGVTFIDPFLWSLAIGPVKSLEGAFWSLYVEVKFYALFGAMYFVMGWRNATLALVGLFAASTAISMTVKLAPVGILALAGKGLHFIGADYWGWFAAGAIYYKYMDTKQTSYFLLATLLAIVSALVVSGSNWLLAVVAVIVALVFAASMVNTSAQAILSSRVMQIVGFASYPLYLIHENMMVAMIVKVGKFAPWLPSILIPALPIFVVIGLGWLIAKYVEPLLKNLIRSLFQRFTSPAQKTNSTSPCTSTERR